MELKIEKSKYPNEDGTYTVFLHRWTIRGDSWKRIFKGTYKDCREFKKRMLECTSI